MPNMQKQPTKQKRKNAAAAALARHKWARVPAAERKRQLTLRSREAHDSMTPAARSERARKAAIAMHRAAGHKLKSPAADTEVHGEPTAEPES